MAENGRYSKPYQIFRLLRVAVLLTALIWAFGFARSSTQHPEYRWFKEAYGSSSNSRNAEEWIVRDFFKDQRGGFFVDVGSYHYKNFSNTYYLEHALGWSGLAIDAQEEFAADYAKFRPNTQFFTFFVSDRSEGVESFYVSDAHRLIASSKKDLSPRSSASVKERKVPTITLDDLLARTRTEKIDFLSMDIELAELKALAGFDLERYRPRLVCVEAHPEIRQQLLDYFTERRYRLVARYLRADPHNLWFAPADAPLPPGLEGVVVH